MIETLELVIKEHPFSHGLSDEQLDFITGRVKNVQFPEKHVMFTQGDPANEFYFIRRGAVSVISVALDAACVFLKSKFRARVRARVTTQG